MGGCCRGPQGLLLGRIRRVSFLPGEGKPRMPVRMHPGLLPGITEDKGHLFPPESTELADLLRNGLAVQIGQGWSSRAQLLPGTNEAPGLNYSTEESSSRSSNIHPQKQPNKQIKTPPTQQCLLCGVERHTKGVWGWGWGQQRRHKCLHQSNHT